MVKKIRFPVILWILMAGLVVLGAPVMAQGQNRMTTHLSDPIPGSVGDTLHATIAVLARDSHPGRGAAIVTVEAFDAGATNLPPLASLEDVRVPAGRSVRLAVPFQRDGQWIVLRTTVRQLVPGSIAAVAGSTQTMSVDNVLWGDYFYVDTTAAQSAPTSPPVLGTYGDKLTTTVAVVPGRSARPGDLAQVTIEAFDADGTDQPPIAELSDVVPFGSSVKLEVPFAPGSSSGGLQAIVLRVKAVPVRPGAAFTARGSVLLGVPSATLLVPYFEVDLGPSS